MGDGRVKRSRLFVWLVILIIGATVACDEQTAAVATAPLSPTARSLPLTTVSPTSLPTLTATQTATLNPTLTATVRIDPTEVSSATPTTPTSGMVVNIVEPPTPEPGAMRRKLLGFSTNGYAIEAFQFGNGPNEIVFVGGMHGGYEWNTILLAYGIADYFAAYGEQVPESVTLTIIPSANPDGQVRVTGTHGRFDVSAVGPERVPGRFNGNYVDLNRNWDCEWQTNAFWGENPVSGGSAPFSEAESRLLRDYFLSELPQLVVFWHSKAPGVYLGECEGILLRDSEVAGAAYAAASGYPFEQSFDYYPITGDASNYLARVGIPSIAVELRTRELTELNDNLNGVLALLALYK